MTLNEFKKSIGTSSVKSGCIGTGIFAFGVFIVWLILSGADPQAEHTPLAGTIVLWTLAVICLIVGVAIVYYPAKAAADVRKGRHPVVKAIEQRDMTFVLWMYEYVTQVQGGGSDHQVWIFSRDGKQFIIATNATKAKEILQYLHEQFPPALYGYSKEYEELYKQRLAVMKRN